MRLRRVPRTPARPALALLAAAALALPGAPARGETVALELALAVDASASVGGWEYYMQTHGYADAFRSPELLGAIRSLGEGGIAVSLILWSGAGEQSTAVDWHVIRDGAAAEAFAAAILAAPRTSSGSTAIGDALLFAARSLIDNDIAAPRRTIDLSGDGSDNDGFGASRARDLVTLNGITINALAILSGESTLEAHYRDEVIGGANAFVEVAEDYADVPARGAAQAAARDRGTARGGGRRAGTRRAREVAGCLGVRLLAESGFRRRRSRSMTATYVDEFTRPFTLSRSQHRAAGDRHAVCERQPPPRPRPAAGRSRGAWRRPRTASTASSGC